MSPVQALLTESQLVGACPLIAYSDSSWQDCPDTGRSTGGMLILCQGGLVEAASFVPDPVAMSSAESEYNAACTACIGIAHLRMLVQELPGNPPDSPLLVPLLIDSKSAMAMGLDFGFLTK
jgi:hypothetical protein